MNISRIKQIHIINRKLQLPVYYIYKEYLFQLLEDVAEVNFLADDTVEILDFHMLLLHRVAVTDSNTAVVE